jgi:hypothetical protein
MKEVTIMKNLSLFCLILLVIAPTFLISSCSKAKSKEAKRRVELTVSLGVLPVYSGTIVGQFWTDHKTIQLATSEENAEQLIGKVRQAKALSERLLTIVESSGIDLAKAHVIMLAKDENKVVAKLYYEGDTLEIEFKQDWVNPFNMDGISGLTDISFRNGAIIVTGGEIVPQEGLQARIGTDVYTFERLYWRKQ